MIELAGIFALSFTLALSGAIMPGPLLTITLAHAGERGALAGPLVVLGHALAETALVVAVLAGFGGLLGRPAVAGVIALAGGGLLVAMGAGMIRVRRTDDPGQPARPPAPPGAGPVAAGLMASVSNPYWALWWGTVGVAYLAAAAEHGWPGLAVFFSGHILADLGWFSLVALAVSRGCNAATPALRRGLAAGCGLFLVGFGLWFVGRGIRLLGATGGLN